MEELNRELDKIIRENPVKYIFSSPVKPGGHIKAVLAPMGEGWQLEKFTKTQVFHRNLEEKELQGCILQLLQTEFTQLHAFGGGLEIGLRITKKGKILTHRTKGSVAAQPRQQHNRQKNYLLPEGTVVPALVDMGVFTPAGKVVNSMQEKYRQINRFIELVDDELRQYDKQEIQIVDFGCGKSYLTFILYYYLVNIRGVKARIVGLDLKADVVEKCNRAAEKYGYAGLNFCVGDIAEYSQSGGVDMVISLHACDTATDYALAKAVEWNAEYLFSVPCCQHELNGQIQSDRFSILTRYGLVKERVAALMTDAIRGNLLEACGYRTQLVEFVDLAHTPKNLLIRGRRAAISAAKKKQALDEVDRLEEEFSLSPTLHRLLIEMNRL